MEYATRLMVALARVSNDEPMAAERLSHMENVPVDYVNQILLNKNRQRCIPFLRRDRMVGPKSKK